jgi:predicted  nucleic acid-binding Zn-ribbon protein
MFHFLPALIFIFIFFTSCLVCNSQSNKPDSVKISISNQATSAVKSSPAFAEIILRKTELEAELESLLVSYTEDFPKIKEIRFEMDSLKKGLERLSAVKAAESSKLTLALGKLMVRKAELETDLWNLRKKYDDNHPEAKRAKRKIEIYELAIREILG